MERKIRFCLGDNRGYGAIRALASGNRKQTPDCWPLTLFAGAPILLRAIDLAIKIPESAHVEIVTGKHSATMHGIPSSASLTSLTGDIKVEFPAPVNADISAKSTSGAINSRLPQLVSNSGHVLQSRLGTGAQILRINTPKRRRHADCLCPAERTERAKDSPVHIPWNFPPRPAGTPAPVSDTQEISEGDVIRVDSQLVTLNMSVIDRNTNRGLLGLSRSDFRLFENGAEQQILQFESSAAPFDLLLLIDLSGSTRDKVKLIRAAALRFINAARPFDRIGVITFAGKPNADFAVNTRSSKFCATA